MVVSAGTYHLPFDRLSRWVEAWLVHNPGARVVMQHGPSAPVVGAENVEILPYDELLELCRHADAVVLQGGAGGVMDMRALGIVPIVVPRVPGDREVVDDHQLVFSREMESLGIIRRALEIDELHRLLDASLATGADDAPPAISTPGAETVRELLSRPVRRSKWHRIPVRLVRSAAGIIRSKLR